MKDRLLLVLNVLLLIPTFLIFYIVKVLIGFTTWIFTGKESKLKFIFSCELTFVMWCDYVDGLIDKAFKD